MLNSNSGMIAAPTKGGAVFFSPGPGRLSATASDYFMSAIDAAAISTPRMRGSLLVAGAALAWSTGGLLTRLISADAFTTVFWRSFSAAIFLIAYVLWRERGRGLAAWRDAGWAGVAVGFCFGAASDCYVVSLSLTKVANTLIVLSTSPFMAALLGWIVLGEPVRARTWAAIAAAFAGIAIMVANSIAAGNALGDLLAFAPPVAVATNAVIIRRHRAVRMAPSAALAAIFATLFVVPFSDPSAVAPGDVPFLIAFGVGQLGLGLILFITGARLIPPAEVSLIAILEVILAPLWVWLLLSEQPSSAALFGGGIVLTALVAHALLDARDARSLNAPI
jgi:drug/metabolite transporter (DMT)-like permease